MIFPVYSIRDNKGNSFQQLLMSANDVVVMRSLAESLVMKRDVIMAFSPKDFDLYRVGKFDMDKGQMIPESPVVLVANCAEVLSNYGYAKEE